MLLLDAALTIWSLAGAWLVLSPQNRPPPGVLSPETRSWIDSARERWGVQGASVVVVTAPKDAASDSKWGDETVSFGVADAAGNNVTDETLFTIASNSKLFTALAIGLLIENGTALPSGGRLAWDTKLADILPGEWELFDAYASDHVDITDLASMRSGLPSHNLAQRDVPVEETVRMLRHLRPTSEIRQAWQYNNLHYNVLARVVRVLSGKALEEYVGEHILRPLGMRRTTYNATQAREWGGVDGFVHTNVNFTRCKEESRGARNMSRACTGTAVPIGWWTSGDGIAEAGAGGINSCTRDLAKWLRELLAPQVLPPALLKQLATPIMYQGGRALSPHLTAPAYGMAQVTQVYRGHELVLHTGGFPGQTSLVLRAPNDGIAIGVLTNDDRALAFFYATAYRVLDELLGLEHMEWEDVLFKDSFSVPAAPAPGDTPPPAPVEGRFMDAGYGALDVSRLDDGPLMRLVREKFALYNLPTRQPVFATRFKHLFTDHLVFTHANASLWHVAVVKVHDRPEKHKGMNKAAQVVAAFIPFKAVVTPEGIGMFGRFSIPGRVPRLPQPSEEDVEARAEVWFARQSGNL